MLARRDHVLAYIDRLDRRVRRGQRCSPCHDACPDVRKAGRSAARAAVGVRDGKVVAFCSQECATAAETQAGRRARAPRSSQPTKTIKRPRTEPPASAAAAARRRPRGVPITPAKGVPASQQGPRLEARSIEITREKSRARMREDAGAIQIADTGQHRRLRRARRPQQGLARAACCSRCSPAPAWRRVRARRCSATTRSRSAAPPQRQVVAPPRPDAPPTVTPAAAPSSRRRPCSRKNLKSDSPRVQRVAASALARTGDTDAIGQLAAALGKETSDIAKLEIAYALARGGDKRGSDALVAALAAARRDVRLEAARRLALLGDKRATRRAHRVPRRLAAAPRRGRAARVSSPIRRRSRCSTACAPIRKRPHDEQARATIALGHAGRKDVIPALERCSPRRATTRSPPPRSPSFTTQGAPGARAAARPADARAPSPPARCAGSIPASTRGRCCRRCSPPSASAKDTEQVEAAEAVLLLAGPATWAAHE